MDENPYKSPASDGTDGRSSIETALDEIDKLFASWRIGVMICVICVVLVSPWKDPISRLIVAVHVVVLYFGLRAVALRLLKGKDRRYRYMAWASFMLLLVVLAVLVIPR